MSNASTLSDDDDDESDESDARERERRSFRAARTRRDRTDARRALTMSTDRPHRARGNNARDAQRGRADARPTDRTRDRDRPTDRWRRGWIVYTNMSVNQEWESVYRSSGRNRDAARRGGGGGGAFSAPGLGAARNLSMMDVAAWWCAFRATNFDAGLIAESVGL